MGSRRCGGLCKIEVWAYSDGCVIRLPDSCSQLGSESHWVQCSVQANLRQRREQPQIVPSNQEVRVVVTSVSADGPSCNSWKSVRRPGQNPPCALPCCDGYRNNTPAALPLTYTALRSAFAIADFGWSRRQLILKATGAIITTSPRARPPINKVSGKNTGLVFACHSELEWRSDCLDCTGQKRRFVQPSQALARVGPAVE